MFNENYHKSYGSGLTAFSEIYNSVVFNKVRKGIVYILDDTIFSGGFMVLRRMDI